MLLAMAQLNPIVGDVVGNISRLATLWGEAAQKGVELLITPELYATGYPPEDLALKPCLQKLVHDAIEGLARTTASGPAILIGTPWRIGNAFHNAALLLEGGHIQSVVLKQDLPNYGPFDERRVYVPAKVAPDPVFWHGHKLGVMLCEDMWSPEAALNMKNRGAEILIVMNGSPFETGKYRQRTNLALERVRETGLPLLYVNQVGGQDELVFDGGSFVMDMQGSLRGQARFWEEELFFVEIEPISGMLVPKDSSKVRLPETDESIYETILLGLRDYVHKNGFDSVILGLSGGIDSALVAALAIDAFGVDKVRFVMMPSAHTSPQSIEDATAIGRALGRPIANLSIVPMVEAVEHTLAVQFMDCLPDETEENIQARCRGLLLMALSNKSKAMVLACGNKSEMATGYATLYGDMCGGYAPLKDVYKSDVYRLVAWRNAHKPATGLGPEGNVIPQTVIDKAPSAELRPLQTDQDTLPPYPILDDILTGLVEDDLGVSDMAARGYDPVLVRKVLSWLDKAEYKRRQAPPGPKITRRHLTRDRRYPITNRTLEK